MKIFETNRAFFDYVTDIFKQSGMSQSEIARTLGVTRSNINHALNPRFAEDQKRNGTRGKILSLFGITTSKLIGVVTPKRLVKDLKAGDKFQWNGDVYIVKSRWTKKRPLTARKYGKIGVEGFDHGELEVETVITKENLCN